MRIYINLFFLAILFGISCKSDKVPPGIIPKDQMVGLLTDIHMVNGTLYTISQMPDSLYKYGMGRYMVVLHQHHTDTAQFKKSMRYYATKPADMGAMYDQVLANLKAKSDSLNKTLQKKNNALPHK